MGSKSVSVRDYAMLFSRLQSNLNLIEENLEVVKSHSLWLREASESFEGAAKDKTLEVVKACDNALENLHGDFKGISAGIDKLIAAAQKAERNANARGEKTLDTAKAGSVSLRKK